MSQNGYHPQGMQGYGQPNAQYPNTQFQQNGMNQGYPPVQGTPVQGGYGYDAYRQPAVPGYSAAPAGQVQKGYTTPQVAFSAGVNQGYSQEPKQAAQPYASVPQAQNVPYGVPGGYNIPPQGGVQGSYIPQTPYSPGYTSPGYQPPQQGYPSGYPAGYQQPGYQAGGYNPYGQMGKAPQASQEQSEYNPGIPLNGGGYVPQKVPVRRQPFRVRNWHLIAAGAVLTVLFILSVLVLKSTPLKILTVILAAGTAGVLWVKPLVAENKRLTYSILALVLCLLTAVSFLMKKPAADNSGKGSNTAKTVTEDNTSGNGGIQENNLQQGQAALSEATPVPENKDGNLRERLVTFFTYWSGNRQDEMLPLCAPSWQDKQDNPRTALFYLLQNRVPKDCYIEGVSGTEADTTRKVTVTTNIDRHDGKNPEKFRMTIIMVRENNEWYIDPQSLQSYEKTETPDPNITPTVAPTDTPAIYSNTVLYYNSNGGEYYHYDPDCRNVNKKFKPMAQFTYGELNNEPYSKLKPCNVCGAPLRP